MLGNYDYDWDQRDSAAAAHAQTPRDTTINDITEGLKGLTTDYDGSSAFLSRRLAGCAMDGSP